MTILSEKGLSVTRTKGKMFSKYEVSASFHSGLMDQNGKYRRTEERAGDVIP